MGALPLGIPGRQRRQSAGALVEPAELAFQSIYRTQGCPVGRSDLQPIPGPSPSFPHPCIAIAVALSIHVVTSILRLGGTSTPLEAEEAAVVSELTNEL